MSGDAGKDDSKSGLPIVVAVTGASGSIYAQRLLEVLSQTGAEILMTMSPAAGQVIQQELGIELDVANLDLQKFLPAANVERIRFWDYRDYFSPIASGSHRTRAMIICPCSGSTVSAVVTGAGRNLIHRAADVHLKEKRPLILVPRETPLSIVSLENMHKVAVAGATVMPAMPGFYHGATSVNDLVDFMVARILDHVGVNHHLTKRWGDQSAASTGGDD
jgi:4-hydroxy-3-polyprenylbenzoate decarboxylase